jgi:hypothetical protein
MTTDYKTVQRLVCKTVERMGMLTAARLVRLKVEMKVVWKVSKMVEKRGSMSGGTKVQRTV